jgi:carbon monoxide dehydrogenase subunit G
MEMTGEQLIPASQADVWQALNDPETLKACVPGCEVIEPVSATDFRIEMMAVVGPVKARFKGTLKLSDLQPPQRYLLSFEGSGGAAGFAKGGAEVSLASEGAGTRLAYRANAQVGGKLAQVGSRLVDGVARKMAEEFFTRFNARFAPAEGAVASEAPAAGVPDGAAAPAPTSPRTRVGLRVAAILALVALAVIVYVLRK